MRWRLVRERRTQGRHRTRAEARRRSPPPWDPGAPQAGQSSQVLVQARVEVPVLVQARVEVPLLVLAMARERVRVLALAPGRVQ